MHYYKCNKVNKMNYPLNMKAKNVINMIVI